MRCSFKFVRSKLLNFVSPGFWREISGGTCPGQEKYCKLPQSKNIPTHKIQTIVVSWETAFLLVPTILKALYLKVFLKAVNILKYLRAHTVQWEKEMKA